MQRINRDCRHYRGSMPCPFHKRDGRQCASCRDYDAITARILIVKLGAMGDVLRTTCLLPALRRRWPNAHITWITGAASRTVLAGHPLIDRILTSDACLPALLAERFDAVYGLEADEQSATLATIARAPARFGFGCDEQGRVHPVRDSAVPWWLMGLDDRRKRQNRLTYPQLMLELCELSGPTPRPAFSVPTASRVRAADLHRALGLGAYAAVIGLNTGSGRRWAQKRWTEAGYGGFLTLCSERHPDIAILLLGGPEEVPLNAALMAKAPAGVFDGGCEHPFEDFAALITSIALLVTPDSLGLHAAQAVGTPAIALVGPTSPWELETYGAGAIVYPPALDCISCYRPSCDKPVTCMERLDPAAVLTAAEHVLAGLRSEPAAIRRADLDVGARGL